MGFVSRSALRERRGREGKGNVSALLKVVYYFESKGR